MNMIVDTEGTSRVMLGARLVRLVDSMLRAGREAALAPVVDANLDRAGDLILADDRARYRALVQVLLEMGRVLLSCAEQGGSTAAGTRDRLRLLRRQGGETERYLGFTAAAEALHKARGLDDFLKVLPSVDLGRTYGTSLGPIPRFPLIWAMTAREKPMERVQAMLRAGVRLDLTLPPHEITLLHALAGMHGKGAAKRLEILRLLVQQGADLEARDRHGRTPLHLAVAEGSPDDVRLFLAVGFSGGPDREDAPSSGPWRQSGAGAARMTPSSRPEAPLSPRLQGRAVRQGRPLSFPARCRLCPSQMI
jgi:hypothetical protein